MSRQKRNSKSRSGSSKPRNKVSTEAADAKSMKPVMGAVASLLIVAGAVGAGMYVFLDRISADDTMMAQTDERPAQNKEPTILDTLTEPAAASEASQTDYQETSQTDYQVTSQADYQITSQVDYQDETFSSFDEPITTEQAIKLGYLDSDAPVVVGTAQRAGQPNGQMIGQMNGQPSRQMNDGWVTVQDKPLKYNSGMDTSGQLSAADYDPSIYDPAVDNDVYNPALDNDVYNAGITIQTHVQPSSGRPNVVASIRQSLPDQQNDIEQIVVDADNDISPKSTNSKTQSPRQRPVAAKKLEYIPAELPSDYNPPKAVKVSLADREITFKRVRDVKDIELSIVGDNVAYVVEPEVMREDGRLTLSTAQVGGQLEDGIYKYEIKALPVNFNYGLLREVNSSPLPTDPDLKLRLEDELRQKTQIETGQFCVVDGYVRPG